MKTKELDKIANQSRINLINIIPDNINIHWGGSFSLMEILTVLFFNFLNIKPKKPNWLNRDRLILSKGHGSPALYATMSARGFFSKSWLKKIDQNNSKLPKHAHRLLLPGIEASTGSLGQGLSMGIGIALAAKLQKKKYKIYVIASDGECTEGQYWEAALSASKYKLDNLILIVDHNQITLDNHLKDGMPSLNPQKMFQAAGWEVFSVNGHKVKELIKKIKKGLKIKNKPVAIIAKTIKGKGISFMEDRVQWHSGTLSSKQKEQALKELNKN